MERRGVEIRICLRVDASTEIVVGVRLGRNLRREKLQRRVPPVYPGIADFRLLDAHFCGIGDGVGHAFLKGHSSLATGAHTHCGRQGRNYTLNEKVFHIKTYV